MIPLDTIVQAVREDLGIAPGSTVTDATIGRKVAAAWSEVERWCNQPLVAETGNVVAGLHWSQVVRGRVLLDYFPIQNVVSVTYQRTSTDDPVALDAASYWLNGQWLGFTSGVPSWGIHEITLTVGHADIPPDVADLVADMARVRLGSTGIIGVGHNTLGKMTISESSATQVTKTTSYSTAIANREDWQERLAAYRRLA